MTVSIPFPGTALNVAASITLPGPRCFGEIPTISYAGDNTPPTIMGTAGDDVIYAGNGNDVIDGLGGNDLICGLGGNDEAIGGPGNDAVNGGDGHDTVRGGDGNDIANGGKGDDHVFGGADDDVIAGNDGTDTCNAGTGTKDRITTNGGCEIQVSALVSDSIADTSADQRVIAAAETESNDLLGNEAELLPEGDADSGADVHGGNATEHGDL